MRHESIGACNVDGDAVRRVRSVLARHRGRSFSLTLLSRLTGLERINVKRALTVLTYHEPLLCEDDSGKVMILPPG